MTNDTISGRRLIPLVVALSMVFFILISGVLLTGTYFIAFSTLEREVNQTLEKTTDMAQLSFTTCLDNIRNHLFFLASNSEFKGAVEQENHTKVEALLFELLESENGYFIDAMAVTRPNRGGWADASLSRALPPDVLDGLSKMGNTGIVWQVVSVDSLSGPQVMLVWGTPIVLPSMGKVFGHLWAGIAVNSNLSLADHIRRHIQVTDVAFSYQGHHLISADARGKTRLSKVRLKPDADKGSFLQTLDAHFVYARPLFDTDHGRSLAMWITMPSTQMKDLKQNYTYIIVLLCFILITAGVTMVVLIRGIIRPALQKIVKFTDQAAGEEARTQVFDLGRIQEFNRLGKSVETMVRKIKEKQISLAKAQAIAQLGNWEMDLETGDLIWSDEVFRIVGRGQEDFQPSHKGFLEHVHPEDRRKVDIELFQVKGKNKQPGLDHRIVRGDGTQGWVHGKAELHYGMDGQPDKLLGTIQDITQRVGIQEELETYRDNLEHEVLERTKDLTRVNLQLTDEIRERQHAETALLKAKDEADLANHAKSRFLANMSHEIRTPMNSVIGYLDLSVENQTLPLDIRNNLETATRSARVLLKLINDILDISKMEAGKLELESIKFNLKQLLEDVLDSFEHEIRQKGLSLDMALDPKLASCYLGDKTRLSQVLINLVGNAVKFTDTGGIVLSVAREQNKGLLFKVTDTGIGIEPGNLRLILEPFAQADTGTNRRFGGTGLGTAISREIVELMEGKIWVNSTPGKGTQFCFTVKISESECAASCNTDCENHSRNDRRRPMLPTGDRRFKILFAEDIVENADLSRIRMEQQGHVFTHVWDGQQALDAYIAGDYDLILMDIQMPRMDGLEATRRIRGLEKGTSDPITIIALTASVMQEEKERCFAAGIDFVIGKPVNFPHLFEKMEALIPPNKGRRVSDSSLGPGPKEKYPKSLPSLPGVDFVKGIAQWQDENAYLKALAHFSRDYIDIAGKIKHQMVQKNPEAARRLTHTLKGVAGNLAVDKVYTLAGDLGVLLRNEEPGDAGVVLDELQSAMELVETGMGGLAAVQESESGGGGGLMTKEAIVLLGELLTALEADDPGASEPAMEKLMGVVPEDLLAPISTSLDAFEFADAKGKTRRLIQYFGDRIGENR